MAAHKFTAQYGAPDLGDIAVGAGDAEAQSDTISVNLDVTDMGKAEALALIDKIKAKIFASPWPPTA
ncbi:MAG: hypothetical protein AAGE86_05780 [Pseudomonadota bacterium]